MNATYTPIQTLYDISLAIGCGSNLQEMLNEALAAYIEKLQCFSGSIFQINELNEISNFECSAYLPEIQIPNQSAQIASEIIPSDLNNETLRNFLDQLPIIAEYDNNIFYAIMDLPGYGVIILSRYNDKFESDLVISLLKINSKLGNIATVYVNNAVSDERELNLKIFFESMADLFFITNFEGQILYANVRSCEILKYDRNSLINKYITELYEESNKSLVDKILQNTTQNNISISEFPFISADKIPIFVDSTFWIGQWHGINCIYILSKNITNEKEALIKFEKFFDNNPALMTVNLVPNGEFVAANNAFLETLGYTKEYVLGKRPNELSIIEDKSQSDFISREILANGKIGKFEVTLRKKNGSILHGLFSGEIIQEKNRTYFLAVIIDNTTQKKAEQKLLELNNELKIKVGERTQLLEDTLLELKEIIDEKDSLFMNLEQSENKYKILINNISKALILLHGDFFEILNHTFYEIFNFDKKRYSIHINDFFKLFPERHHQTLQKHLQSVGNSETIKPQFEITGLRNDEQEFELEISIVAMTIDENSEILIILKDISESKMMEAKLAHALKMESIGTLAAGIAHEINTPLQYIANNTNFLKSSFDEIKEYIDTVNLLQQRDSDQNQINIINSILESKNKNDIDFLLEEIPVAINENSEGIAIVSKIVLAMKEFSHPGQKKKDFSNINKGIEATVNISKNEWKYCSNVEMDIDEDLPDAFCDIGSLNQVFLNLIINARDTIQERFQSNGEKKGLIKIITCRNGESIEIKISDNGMGIEPKNKLRIFDQFFTTKQVGKGTGQGLSMAYTIIVKDHGGDISFESEVGVGTEFTISIPIHLTEKIEEGKSW